MEQIKEEEKDIKRIIEMVNDSNISSIKQTVTQIINIINDPNSSARDLKNAVEIDPPLAARLLKLSNSAYYGSRKKIDVIQEAIICIGFEGVKELALSQKISEVFETNDYYDGYSRSSLWKHSVAVALCSKLIYRREFRERGANIYVAGLLHDIGIIVEDQFLDNEFNYILNEFKNGTNNLSDIEKSNIGFNHADIGRALAENWGFPDELAAAIQYHHNFEGVQEEHKKSAQTLYISDTICQNKNIGYCDAPCTSMSSFRNCLMSLKIKQNALDLIMEEVEEEINKMEKAGWF